MDEKDIQQILLTQIRIEGKVDRLVSDIESEKETRKRRNDQFDNRLRNVEEWKNNLQGRLLITGIISGGIMSIIVGLIIWLITK